MANKTGVVRMGRTLVLGVKDGDKVKKKAYSPGDEVTLDSKEFDRLFKAGVVAARGSGEAKVAQAAADQLPADFPGLDALKKEGITTFSALEEVDDLVAIKGIGEATAAEIEEALAAHEA